jgi:hypothetical protein
MKSIILLFLFIVEAISRACVGISIVRVCIGVSWQQNLLQEGALISLESNTMKNFYLAARGNGCIGLETGRCGRLYAMSITNSTLLEQTDKVHFKVIKNQDYYCLKSNRFNALLGFEGQDCLNTTSRDCGHSYLYRNSNCTEEYGFKVGMVQNNYIIQSLRYPNAYLFLNTSNCHANSRFCGSLRGRYFSDQDIENSLDFQKVYFNLHTIRYGIIRRT